jgi:hypothetical protein
MSRDGDVTRETLVSRLKSRLLARSAPRFEMALIVGATATVGFFASRGLLALGLHGIAFRYALAVTVAYVAFLFFVWIWLLVKSDRLEPDADLGDAVDALDLASPPWDSPVTPADSPDSLPLADLDVGGDELTVVVILAAATCAGAVAAGYVVYSAPGLLAEVLLDGTLSYGLYRRLRRVERRHWLESAVRRTWLPAAGVAASFVVAATVMQWYAPEATSIGQVWQRLTGRTPSG